MNTLEEKLDEFFGRDEREASPKPWLRDNSSPSIVHLDTAVIAEELAKRVHVDRNTSAFIVGTDGTPVMKTGCRWSKDLAKWLGLGCSIDYLLLDPRTDCLERFLELQAASPQGKLQVFVVRKYEQLSEEARNYRKLWETFHFAGFESNKGRQFWTEGVHERGEISAKDCTYYPPEALSGSGMFDVYKSQFGFMVQNYAVPACSPPKGKAPARAPVAWTFNAGVPA